MKIPYITQNKIKVFKMSKKKKIGIHRLKLIKIQIKMSLIIIFKIHNKMNKKIKLIKKNIL